MQHEGFNDALGASYRLLELHGRGATGEVWRAIDRRTDEVVAAKLLRTEHVGDSDLVARFVRERSILTGLKHPNVVLVRDLVVEGDRLAIVMDFVDGGSLREVLRDGPLPPRLALDTAAAVLDGLAAAHERGVFHRDIKPDNVLLTSAWRDLDVGAVRLSDFGISRIVAEGGTSTTGLLGTPEYMSPEQLTTGDADLPADVYAVGILLYELLAGRTPFAGPGTDYAIAHRHVTSEPPPLPVPEALWQLLSTLLDKDPTRRPTAPTAAAAVRRLQTQHAELVDLPPLEAQVSPGEFDPSRGPATLLRGAQAPEQTPAAPGTDDPSETSPAPDLGAPGQETLYKPLPRPTATPATTEATPERRSKPAASQRWRDPKVLGLIGGALVLLVAAVAFAVLNGSDDKKDEPTADTGPVTATQQDQQLPTGLAVRRQATFDPQQGDVDLSITYSAQKAPLTGPFLEVVPGLSGSCPDVSWQGAEVETNLPTTTGVTTPCGWSIEPAQVEAQGSVTVTASVDLDFGEKDPETALQEWLDSSADATTAATSDPEITSTSYPVQRMQSISVVAPQRTPVSRTTLTITLQPVWPSGPDTLNPLYVSPSVGQPSSLLTAVAGGESGVRFSDGCAGAVAVSGDGLVVTALSMAPDCQINAQVGNFTDLTSNAFAIVTRGS